MSENEKSTNTKTDITEEMIKDAIANCHWRHIAFDIPICRGQAGICQRLIEQGRCSTLKDLFKGVKINEFL